MRHAKALYTSCRRSRVPDRIDTTANGHRWSLSRATSWCVGMRREERFQGPDLSCAMLNELVRMMDSLPYETRAVFTLRKVYQLEHSEIATRLGISESQVAECLVGAVKHLDGALSKFEHLEDRCGCPYCRPR